MAFDFNITLSSDSEASPADEIYGLMAALDSSGDLLGPFHPQTLAIANRLAVAFWRAGEIDQAVWLLDQVLDRLNFCLEPEDPTRVDMLSTLAKILFEQRHMERAGVIQREVLEWRVRHSGVNAPASLEAKSDLAAILFELGQDEEAASLEEETFEYARIHLGKTHPISCVVAWNRAMNQERRGDPDAARRIIVTDLVWLLAEDPACLDTGQNAVRSMLAARLNWDIAKTC